MSKYPKLYRAFDSIGPDGLTIEFKEYTVIGETPQCWYVIASDLAHWPEIKGFEKHVLQKRKRVLKNQNGRRFCYVSKSDAMKSYQIRKRRQLGHADLAIARAQAGIAAAEKLLALESEIELPMTQPSEYIQGLNWEVC